MLKHGHAFAGKPTPEYTVWIGMKGRCYNLKNHKYQYYGALGVRMSDEWVADFAAFFRDMGPRPSVEYSIDRWPDRNGNYEKGNCRWATQKEQQNNRRPRRSGCKRKPRVNPPFMDLTGQRFGRLLVLHRASNPKPKVVVWSCQCDCGAICVVRTATLRNGMTRSCGCYHRDQTKAYYQLKRQLRQTASL